MTYTAHREVDVMDGSARLASFEARYTFTIAKGITDRTWANAAEGFHPAEGLTLTITDVEVRWHINHAWQSVDGQAWDMLTAEVPDVWFLEQAMEDAE